MLRSRNGCDFELVPARREPIVHELFTHTAGFSYGSDEKSAIDDLYRRELWGAIERDPRPALDEVMAALAALPLAFEPGTAFRYGVSVDVLGYVVQAASGLPFEAFVKERILDPLGMVDTSFSVPAEKAERLAAVYGPKEGGGIRAVESSAGSRYLRSPGWPSGGGGLVSTLGDYYRFGQMLLNKGSLDGIRFLGRKTVEWMLMNHLPEGLRQDWEERRAYGFGLGGSVLLDPGLSSRPGSAGRFGWGGAANTEWWIDPAEDINCILMTQYMPAFTLPLVEDFAQTVYQALE